ncbi:MAG: cytochrome c-type biogenesis protein CcmH, partial [Pseudorhodobacter sp.]
MGGRHITCEKSKLGGKAVATSIFWIAAGVMALAVAAMLILALRRSPQVLEQAAQFDRQVYRDQLREIERDLARSVI